MRRTKSREFALQILFSLDPHGGQDSALEADHVDSAIALFFEAFGPKKSEEIADLPYLLRLLKGICADLAAIDAQLASHSEHWKLYRMTRIDRNILRIGAEELKSFTDVPPKVTLDECVELAKRFGTEDSSAFVNGVLDKVRQSLGRSED